MIINWFERHKNWITGIFGHLLVFLLVINIYSNDFGCIMPNVYCIVENIVSFRSPMFNSYLYPLIVVNAIVILLIYIFINAWYLRTKRQSYKKLWWLCLAAIPLVLGLLEIFAPIYSSMGVTGCLYPFIESLFGSSTFISLSMLILEFLLLPVYFAVVAFILLRLKNMNPNRSQP